MREIRWTIPLHQLKNIFYDQFGNIRNSVEIIDMRRSVDKDKNKHYTRQVGKYDKKSTRIK